MKKHILFAFFTSLVLILSGCGSNDKVDSNDDTANKSITLGASISSLGQDFNISMSVTKNLSSAYKVALKDFELLSIGGCTVSSTNLPDAFEMTGAAGSTATVQFSGTFENDCTPTDYKIKFAQVTSKDGRSKVETVTYDSTASSGGTGGDTTPVNGFFNATTPMEITQANQAYEIKVQVLEDGYAVSGKTVRVKSFDAAYGTISNPSATTGMDGYAVFNYTSPAALPANGSAVTIELTHDNNGTIISQNIVLNFNSSSSGGTQYSLINPTNIIVTAASSTKEISIDLIDSATGVGVSGKDISIQTIDARYGAISPSTTQTDNAGKATFSYTAPTVLIAGTETAVISFTDSLGTTITETVTITTVPPAGGGGTQFSFVNESNITVTAASTDYTLSVDLVDASTGVGVEGKEVSISSISSTYGSISPAKTNTNAAGKALFTYTSPAQLTAGSTMATLRFTDSNNITITKNITITVVPPVGGGSQFSLINANGINIQFAGERKEIAVQLVNTSTLIPQAGEAVTAKSIPVAFGRIESVTVTTGTDGYARFTYIAADPLTNGTQPLELIYTDSNGVVVSATVNIVVNSATTTSDYNITSITSPVEINQDNELKTISAVVVNSAGVGVKDIDVSITAISDIKFGAITSASTIKTDASGRALFTYQAPANVALVDGNSTTVTLSLISNGVTVDKDVEIRFDKVLNFRT